MTQRSYYEFLLEDYYMEDHQKREIFMKWDKSDIIDRYFYRYDKLVDSSTNLIIFLFIVFGILLFIVIKIMS